jgi:hypothetical protein
VCVCCVLCCAVLCDVCDMLCMLCAFLTRGCLCLCHTHTQSFVILPWLGRSVHGYLHVVVFNGLCLVAAYNHWRGGLLHGCMQHITDALYSPYLCLQSTSVRANIVCVLSSVCCVLCAMCMCVYVCAAMTTDPGAVPKDAKPLPGDLEEVDLEGGGQGGR